MPESEKYPWMQVFPADWFRDTAILSPSTRGIWIDALLAMHAMGRRGSVSGTWEQLARVLRCTPAECEMAVDELETTCVADVLRTDDGRGNDVVTLINRRMQREHKDREQTKLRVTKHRGNGDCNASVTPSVTGFVTPLNGGCNAPVTAHTSESESESEGEHARAHTRARNMSNAPGANTRQESESKSPPVSDGKTAITTAERITLEKELPRVEEELKRLKERGEGGYTLNEKEKLRRAELRERRAEILELLGMKA